MRSTIRAIRVIRVPPSKAVASCTCGIACGGMINRQVQCHHTVATGGVGKCVRSTIRAIRIIRVPPSKAVAGGSRGIAGAGILNC